MGRKVKPDEGFLISIAMILEWLPKIAPQDFDYAAYQELLIYTFYSMEEVLGS
jgi:hypothetical protein